MPPEKRKAGIRLSWLITGHADLKIDSACACKLIDSVRYTSDLHGYLMLRWNAEKASSSYIRYGYAKAY